MRSIEIDRKEDGYGESILSDNKMIKIYWVPGFRENREYLLIKQGLDNNPRVELVGTPEESDFVFHFYYKAKYEDHYTKSYPREKTVVIDYHDNPTWYCNIPCFAYFKRSWVWNKRVGDYTVRMPISHPVHKHLALPPRDRFYPLTMAIMDEFIVREELERDVVLSCTLREKEKRGHVDRIRVLRLLEGMNIQGNVQIGQLNRGNMKRFDEPDMRDYFRLLKRSRIVVTCNPSMWEGDHRTWEAFANGALVFVDRTLTPLRHSLIDREHCIFYDLSDRGLQILKHKIFYYLRNPEEAEAIAKAGHDFAMKYHRTSNRIDEMLDVIL